MGIDANIRGPKQQRCRLGPRRWPQGSRWRPRDDVRSLKLQHKHTIYMFNDKVFFSVLHKHNWWVGAVSLAQSMCCA